MPSCSDRKEFTRKLLVRMLARLRFAWAFNSVLACRSVF